MSLYASRLNEIREMEKLRKGQIKDEKNNKSISKMTQAEKDQRIREMQASALALNEERRDRSGLKAETQERAEPERKDPKFFKEM